MVILQALTNREKANKTIEIQKYVLLQVYYKNYNITI